MNILILCLLTIALVKLLYYFDSTFKKWKLKTEKEPPVKQIEKPKPKPNFFFQKISLNNKPKGSIVQHPRTGVRRSGII